MCSELLGGTVLRQGYAARNFSKLSVDTGIFSQSSKRQPLIESVADKFYRINSFRYLLDSLKEFGG